MHKATTVLSLDFHEIEGRGLHGYVQKRVKITFLVRLRHICFINFAVKLLYGVAAHLTLHLDAFKASGTLARGT